MGQLLGPQQLKYMTVLKDSSDCFHFLSETAAADGVESFLAWETDLTWFLAYCWTDLIVWFHRQIPWSFKASTTPTLAATTQALLEQLIFAISVTLSKFELTGDFE